MTATSHKGNELAASARLRSRASSTLVLGFVAALALLLALSSLFSVREAEAGHGGFHFRKSITIDRTKVGEAGTTTLSNYPMLFSVTGDLDLRTTTDGGDVTNASGHDIIFRALDSTTCGGASVCTLDHQIEKYTSAAGGATLVAWVRLPSVNGQAAASNTVIYIYYGNSSITTSTERINQVWDSNHKGVWHLKETAGGASAIKDSTSNANHGTNSGTVTFNATGQIDGAFDFNGGGTTDDIINVTDATSLKPTAITVEAWINPTGLDPWGPPVIKTTGTAWADGYGIVHCNSADTVNCPGSATNEIRFYINTFNGANLFASSTVTVNSWNYVVGTYDGANIRLFVNGVQVASTAQTAAINHTTDPLSFGADDAPNGDAYDGRIDEVRISNVARSAAWILTNYNNHNSPSTFYTLGAEEVSPTTAVTLMLFTATGYDGAVLLRWRTGYEVNNLGFNIYREEGGQYVQITPSLVAGSALFAGARTELTAGRSYSWWDDSVLNPQSSSLRYWLEDVDLNGQRNFYGPVEVQPAAIGGRLAASEQRQAELLSRLGKGVRGRALGVRGRRTQSSALSTQSSRRGRQSWSGRRIDVASGARTPVQVQRALAGQAAVKLLIQEEGWYRVQQPQLVAAGLDARVDPRSLQLFVSGVEQPILVAGEQDGRFDSTDFIEFYGLALDTASTDTQVYWLVWGSRPGRRIRQDGGRGNDPGDQTNARLGALPQSFRLTAERKDRTIYFAALRNGDAENFFGSVISGEPVELSLNVHHLDVNASGDALLEVVLQGVSNVTHQVKVNLNGIAVGSAVFAGQERGSVQIPVSQRMLRNGENVLTLIAEGGATDVSLVDVIRLTYWHTYTADDNTLFFTASGNDQVVIAGFTSSAVRIIDITNPNEVQELIGKTTAQENTYAVTLRLRGRGERRLWAFTDARAKRPQEVLWNQPSAWHQGAEQPEYIIITHEDFRDQVASLKALREKQGFSVAVIDVEDLYDEFNFGVTSPRAIKDFLLHAKNNWRRPPRFVLLVGDASVDPRNYLGFGDFDFVPTKLIDTSFLETASDDWFADFNEDGLPEMAVGRLPVRTAEEAATMVSKIVGYEQSGGNWRKETLVVADNNDIFDFETASSQLNRLIPADIAVHQVFRGRTDVETARREILARMNQGQLIVNYMGHGSVEVWAGEGLFTSADARGLNNGERLPFVVSMTCLNGLFHDVFTESLAEALMKAEQGGAVAVWAPSGASVPEGQAIMNQELFRLLFNGKSLTLGEAIMQAKAAASDTDVRRTWILFGDPATRIR